MQASDVDRAKRFYADLGWRIDSDVATGDSFRIVQLTPQGHRLRQRSGPP